MGGVSISKVPSPGAVLPYYGFAAVAFFAFCLLMPFSADAFIGHYFHPRLLAITHIAALGWASMIIFGASFQLLPVILETSLFSEKLAKLTFYLFAAGISGLSYSFWNFNTGFPMQASALLLLLGIFSFVLNAGLTARKAPVWNIHADFIFTAYLWLLVTGVLGTLMVFNFSYAFLPKSHLLFLKIHAHLGITGWFILLIAGVGSRLIPMFLLAHQLNFKKMQHAYYLINAGLIGFAADSYFREEKAYLPLYTLLMAGGILFFFSFVFDAFRKGVRKKLDVGMRHTLASFALLLLPIFIGTYVSMLPPKYNELLLQVYLVYGVSVFLGFLSSLLLGQTFKTLPFIVWLKLHKSRGHTHEGPLPKDLYSEKLANVQFVTFLLSIPVLITGILLAELPLIQIGSVLLLITSVLYNINVFKILLYHGSHQRQQNDTGK